ncbi:hypothetical protein SCATT_17390 [Streptantibioticus cattleyicolor NRRL 8057 = DSM 46488]|uniref:Uncharacterized protein n=1 Tax=Streptantibioticus cattleyicolor (strain ATCC 35852 / DSM 46488 / JCM 4925 / NBRC 14057 / NRRL 8057) TaxID=1003195 RepID=G8WQ51_STREN|nr:hypothetical protein SCATT_17390 [Streptantibioticus cattleyicolor NRRL 8057 = DSM 46488]
MDGARQGVAAHAAHHFGRAADALFSPVRPALPPVVPLPLALPGLPARGCRHPHRRALRTPALHPVLLKRRARHCRLAVRG